VNAPKIAQKGPFAVDVEAGRIYYWCACGQSGKQPFCDGSHKGSGLAPKPYKAETSCEVHFAAANTRTPA
jgi:CDGSH-type Zn-finger protein